MSSTSYAHEQNEAVEILNRTLINKVRALLKNVKLLKYLQEEALNIAVYLYNRTLYTSLDYKTLYEVKYGEKLD